MEPIRYLELYLVISITCFIIHVMYIFASYYEFMSDPMVRNRMYLSEPVRYRVLVDDVRRLNWLWITTGGLIIFTVFGFWLSDVIDMMDTSVSVLLFTASVTVVAVSYLTTGVWTAPIIVTLIIIYMMFFSIVRAYEGVLWVEFMMTYW